MTELVLVSPPDAGVVTVTLNRPDKRNALSIALRDKLSDVLDRLATEEPVKVVVVTGAGEVFCAGFDLAEFSMLADPDSARRLWASSDRYHQRLLSFPLPTLAAVNGPALAGGFDLTVMCDVRIAAESACFAHPEIAFGDVVYGPLHDLVGGAIARDLCLTGRTIDSAEARSLGLVSAVVSDPELAAASQSLAQRIAGAPRDVLVRTKAKAIRRAALTEVPTLDL
jgi:enoyl-CoA hydratase/carnithine racemase